MCGVWMGVLLAGGSWGKEGIGGFSFQHIYIYPGILCEAVVIRLFRITYGSLIYLLLMWWDLHFGYASSPLNGFWRSSEAYQRYVFHGKERKKRKSNTFHALILSIKFQVFKHQSFRSREFIPWLLEAYPGFPGPLFKADED